MFLVNSKKQQFNEIDTNGFFINNREVGQWMYNSGISERSIIDMAGTLFGDEKKTFVDIGAHIGTYSWLLANKFDKVVSFECNPEVYNVFCANIYLKGLSDKITAHKIGLSNENGKSIYYKRPDDGGGNGFTEIGREGDNKMELEIRTLDSYNLDNIGFIKIDVEGHELQVLQGAKETINKYSPVIMFESWPPTNEIFKKLQDELFDYLRNIDYEIIPVSGVDNMYVASKKAKN